MTTTVVIYNDAGTSFTIHAFPDHMEEAITRQTSDKRWGTLSDFHMRGKVDAIDPTTFINGSAVPLKVDQ